jgi:hypothetical protein
VRIVGCRRAREVVRCWGRRFRRDGRASRRVWEYSCRGRIDRVEGLVVRCARVRGPGHDRILRERAALAGRGRHAGNPAGGHRGQGPRKKPLFAATVSLAPFAASVGHHEARHGCLMQLAVKRAARDGAAGLR